MITINHLILLMVPLVISAPVPKPDKTPDLVLLQEMLKDRENARGQSQAALLLLQNESPEAEMLIRQGLQQIEDPELFQTIATAIRTTQDNRFVDELIRALSSSRANVRQTAADTLSIMTDLRMVARLQTLVLDTSLDANARQAAIWVMAHCGRKRAVGLVMEFLENPEDPIRRSAAEVLADLSGQNYGSDITRWQAWWDKLKDLSNEKWMENRLLYQTARVNRLNSELDRARAQILRMHQQLYNRLPVGERLTYVQSVADQEDSAVRLLAVNWVLEQLNSTDAVRQQVLSQILLRLSHDGTLEVQRAAVSALGRVSSQATFDRLRVLLNQGRGVVRAAAARSLAMQARGTSAEALNRQKLVIPDLQKALEDPALEVVIEAAEDLGVLGALEAGPVLTGLLLHPSGQVRQTAAQALERVADVTVIDSLLKALNDTNVNVRFSILGAIARAISQPNTLLEPTRQARLLNRLEVLLVKDVDPGVRSRAATVLGETASPEMLGQLWKVVRSAEDTRVQDKAWGAMIEIIIRSGKLSLLKDWDQVLKTANQGPRRIQLLTDVTDRWKAYATNQESFRSAQEMLIRTELELGKWSVAFIQVREMLSKPGTGSEQNQRLVWLLEVGNQAIREGNRTEALHVIEVAETYLPSSGELVQGFDNLRRAVSQKDE